MAGAKSARVRGAVFAALAALSAAAWGRDFDVRVLTATNGVCRAPSVSETGLAAWVQFSGMDGGAADVRADLWICPSGGEPQNLTGDQPRFSGRIEQPVACGGGVCFLGWYAADAEEGPALDLSSPEPTDAMKEMEREYPSLFSDTVTAAKPAGEGEEGAGEGGNPEESGDADGESRHEDRRDTGRTAGGSAAMWRDGSFERLSPSGHAIYAPVAGEGGAAFLCARRWPYGYDLLAWSRDKGLFQLTTNYFYVQSPRMQGNRLAWQEWDGNDYEIWMYDFSTDEKVQLTSNTFDDTDPAIWGDQVVWVAYPLTTGEIFLWKEGEIKKISDASTENASPAIWDGRVVWQGLDDSGSQREIYYYDGKRTIKLTSNIWDDIEPVIDGGIVAWVSYVDLGDAEIMALDLKDNIPVQLTNDGEEDSCVSIGGGRVLWQTDVGASSYLRMAEAKPLELPQAAE